ncbi:nucleotide pyrophosphohydrolase [Vagococcus zengguangii]|uniref:Nucleotide pyrophosphohydrolase n=1 Tax=Vagococcus zengguangii TaxID=2571750 RepID=A0A4D7CR15_9ENTE|nr:nucleotide pyrophosphohydrolase [Vagococcus zengguangii]QCI86499.1 nucleotide pyrophosphohydrolase [Vagococcus zengguangii]TLG81251.1 nucleotide pyrophosphohydrolase [Vagococcus zengguangii]
MKNSIEKINQFRDERNWRQFHNAKDLALSVSLEAAELLEIFQWRSSEEAIAAEPEHLKEEIADVLIYTLMLADDLQMDVSEIIDEKLAKNAIKYPIVDTIDDQNS